MLVKISNQALGLSEHATVHERAAALARYYEENGQLPPTSMTREQTDGNHQQPRGDG